MATAASRSSNQSLVAYIIGFVVAAVAIVLGLVLSSMPWLVLGAWIAASLVVLLIDHAVGHRTPTSTPGEENFGAIFYGSPVALILIAVMAIVGVIVALALGH